MAITLHGTVSDNTIALDRKTATPIIINGDMQIAQRGTSTSSVSASGFYSVDRYEFFMAGSSAYTISQDTDVPTGYGFYKSYKIDVTTADTLSGTETIRFRQIIEGQNLNVLKYNTSSAETITIAFWVKSNLTGNCVFRINNPSASRHISKVFTINLANTWEKKVFTLAGDTAGSIPNTNAEGLRLEIGLGAGADIKSGSQPTTWQSSSTTADQYAGQVLDITTSTSNEFFITGFQAEVGSFDSNSISPFQFEDTCTSLARCQRYYYVHAEGLNKTIGAGANFSSSLLTCSVHFPTTMRSAPSLDQDTGTDYFRFSRSNNHDLFDSFTQLQRPSVNGVQLDNNSQISGTQGDGGSVYTYNSGAKIAFESEL